MQGRLEISSKDLLALIDQQHPVSEDAFIRFYSALCESLMDKAEIGEHFHKLTDEILSTFSYTYFIDREKTLFDLGASWGGVKIYQLFQLRLQSEQKNETLRHIVNEYYSFFDSIRAHEGIHHAELAAKLHKTPSSLTQLVHRIEKHNLFSSNYEGRVKKYYLTSIGKQIIDGVMQAQARALLTINQSVKKASYTPEKIIPDEVKIRNETRSTPPLNSTSIHTDSLKLSSSAANREESKGYGVYNRRDG